MRIEIIVNYRLDGPTIGNLRHIDLEFFIRKNNTKNKDAFLLNFCGKIANICENCKIYKNVSVHDGYSERPLRIKYIITLPTNEGYVLDAVLNKKEISKKAKKLHDYFTIALNNNKSTIIITSAILLIDNNINNTHEYLAKQIEKEYNVKVMTIEEATEYIKGVLKNGKPTK